MTSATGAVLVLFDSAIASAIVIAFAAEIIRMTCRAIDCISLWRCILRMGIRQRSVHGVSVAAAATRINSVVARVATLRIVAEDVRCPAVC